MNGRTKPKIVPLGEIPNKIYYSISEASEYTGVEPHVLRYWETKFSKLNPKRVGGNQRKYTRGDIELLYEIVHLLYQEGYTLDGAERKLRLGLQSAKGDRQAETELKAVLEPKPVKEEVTEAILQPNPSLSDTTPSERTRIIHEIKQELQEILRLL